MRFRRNSYLIVENGGTLRIKQSSRLVIEEGAELIVHPGAIIELSGENAILELQGKLTLKENAEFAPAGNGFVRFKQERVQDFPSNYLNFEGNNIMRFKGTDNSNKRLEAADYTLFPSELDSLIIDSAQVEIANVKYISIYSSFYAHRATFTGIDTTNPLYGHQGVMLHGQAHVVIDHCHFTGGYYGLVAYLSHLGNPLSITHTNFTRSYEALRVHGKKVVLDHCDFKDNRKSLHLRDVDGACLMKNCKVIGNDLDESACVIGQSGSTLKIDNCLFQEGRIGMATLFTNIRSVCSKYRNLETALSIRHADLDIGNGARNTFDSNSRCIESNQACRINLQKGRNLFSNNRSYYLYGTINSNCDSVYHYDANDTIYPYKLDVKDNPMPAWNGVVPMNLVMNKTNPQQTFQFGLHNWSGVRNMQTWSYICAVDFDLPDLPVPEALQAEFSATDPPGTPADIERLAVVLNEAEAYISWSDEDDGRRDDMRAVAMLRELIEYVNENYSYREEQGEGAILGGPDRLMMDLAFNHYLTALSNAYRFGFLELNRAEEDGEVSEELQFILDEADLRIEHETQAPSVENAYLLRFHFELAKAQTYRIGEHYQEALEILNSPDEWARYPETEVVEHWRCVCETERDYILERIGEEEFAQRMERCMQTASNKRGAPSLPYYEGVPLADVIGASETEGIQAELMPNPTDGRGTILLIGEHGLIHYQLSSPTGEVLQEGEIGEEEFDKTFELPYTSGVYYLSLKDLENDKLKQFKWVIVK